MSTGQLIFAILAMLFGAIAIGCALATRIVAGRIRKAIAYHSEEIFRKESTNIERELQRRALCEAADFVRVHFAHNPAFGSREDLLDFALKQVPVELRSGLYCEFGVYTGSTIRFISERVNEVHGFDSFEGLPENWRACHGKGKFNLNGIPSVQGNVCLHIGWFHETLPGFVRETHSPMAFLHIDSDLYSSAKTVLDYCGELMVPGTVIVFDEFFNYPEWRDGEYKALVEFVGGNKVEFNWLAYNSRSEQVALRITKVPYSRIVSAASSTNELFQS